MRFRYYRVANQYTNMRHAFIPITKTDPDELRPWLNEHVGHEHVDWRFAHRGRVLIKDETKSFGFRMRWG
ncbi:MAG: hypothetical protein EOO77_35185 [Oxalobacteraceae bacterium]|nr:MAG: hypothetical protein EOO77_35185 [Oxalobacteraceae bacterium]